MVGLASLAAMVLVALPVMTAGGWSLLRQHAVGVVPTAAATRSSTPLPIGVLAAAPGSTPTASPMPPLTRVPEVLEVAPAPERALAPAHPPAAPPPRPPKPPPGPPPVTIGVPVYHQQYNLSCEESSLSMALSFFGHPTSEQQVFTQIGIDRDHYWAGKPGGGDPFLDFVGDPNGSEVQQTGYGVYWPPISTAATHFGGVVAVAGQGVAPAAVYSAVRAGHPALVWVTFNWLRDARHDYVAYDGKTIPYAGPEEHAMVVTGINGNSVRVNDPDRGQYWVTFATFEAAYAVYGQMAIVFG